MEQKQASSGCVFLFAIIFCLYLLRKLANPDSYSLPAIHDYFMRVLNPYTFFGSFAKFIVWIVLIVLVVNFLEGKRK